MSGPIMESPQRKLYGINMCRELVKIEMSAASAPYLRYTELKKKYLADATTPIECEAACKRAAQEAGIVAARQGGAK